MTDEIRVGDWVVAEATGTKGKVTLVDQNCCFIEGILGTSLFSMDEIRKLSFSELPPEAWDNLKMDDDALTWDQTIKGAYIDPLTNRKVEWHLNAVDEDIKEKLEGLGWKPPEGREGWHDDDKLTRDQKAKDRQYGGDHYKKYTIQPYEYCLKNKLNNLQSEAISYITRYKDKGGREDLEKAIHTLELLIEAEYDD